MEPLPSKKARVDRVFDSIAPRYDLANDVFSLGLHRLWKKRLIQQTLRLTAGQKVLDLAGGSGDLAEAFAKRGYSVVLADPNRAMLEVAYQRLAAKVAYQEAYAEDLPFADASFDIVVVGFGLRNFSSLERSFSEICRVLKAGGCLGVLEFCEDQTRKEFRLWNGFFRLYNRGFMPFFARFLLLPKSAYQYLATSIEEFQSAGQIKRMLLEAGFSSVRSEALFGNKLQLFLAQKEPPK